MVTLNERRLLAESLSSVQNLATEILVADLGSDDGSPEVARRYGARVVNLPRADAVEMLRPTLVAQATAEWVLLLDPDEVVDPALSRALDAASYSQDFDVVEMTFHTYMMGKRLRGTGWSPNRERHVRFFRKDRVRMSPDVHGGICAEDPARLLRLGEDAGVVHHFNYVSWEQFVSKMNRYTTVEAQERDTAGVLPSLPRLARDLAGEFVNRAVRDGIWRDGWRGLSLLVLMLTYRTLVFSKQRLLLEVGTEEQVGENDRERARGILGT
ncbi:glycosyltransferase family 2 protein [Fodinibacter luteus]